MIERDATGWNEWHVIEGFEAVPDDVIERSAKRASELGVGPWELAILESISYGYGQVESKERMANYAFGLSRFKNPPRAAKAIERCFREGWVQHLTMYFLSEMRQELRRGGYELANGLIGRVEQTNWSDHCDFEDVFAWSNDTELVGLISFTRAGASIFERWEGNERDGGHWAIRRLSDDTDIVYGTSHAAIDDVLIGSYRRIIRQEPETPIGPWCDCWWRRFPNGYRTTVFYETTNET